MEQNNISLGKPLADKPSLSQQEIDEHFMRRCLQLAKNGRQNAKPNPMVGAVIVSEDGRILGEGYHVRCGEGHAEVNAFASVKPEDEHLLAGATIYVSLEPCSHYGKTPPCADLIVAKGVKRVVVGCIDPFARVSGRGIQRLRDAGIEVRVGVLERECRWLNRRFITMHTHHRPYIILKWAQTADGFLDDHYKPTMISNAMTQMVSHRLRAESDAILVGRVTAERDKPQLNVRHWVGPAPERIVLSHSTTIDAILERLYTEQRQSLIVEGGASTLKSFIDRDLWDELRVETGTAVVGEGTKAPQVPATARLDINRMYGNNDYRIYHNHSLLKLHDQ